MTKTTVWARKLRRAEAADVPALMQRETRPVDEYGRSLGERPPR